LGGITNAIASAPSTLNRITRKHAVKIAFGKSRTGFFISVTCIADISIPASATIIPDSSMS
jgi:hypothetical protein